MPGIKDTNSDSVSSTTGKIIAPTEEKSRKTSHKSNINSHEIKGEVEQNYEIYHETTGAPLFDIDSLDSK